jgi:hypothetical protein
MAPQEPPDIGGSTPELGKAHFEEFFTDESESARAFELVKQGDAESVNKNVGPPSFA